jgi:MFS family permease
VGGRLWRHPDFLKLWAGETVSVLGSAITVLALPTLAIFHFHAGPAQVGLLLALNRLPFPLLSIPAGIFLDRRRKRPVMVSADLGRLVALGSVPLALALGWLSLGWLYGAALIAGVLTVFFDVAYLAYMPTLVERRDLLEANTKLEFSYGTAAVLGPGLAALLIQLVGAARAIAADALSFGVSGAALLVIGQPEPTSARTTKRLRVELREGLRFVFASPLLATLLLFQGVSTLGAHAVEAVVYPFAYTRLGLSPGTLGAILVAGGVGRLVGIAISGRAARAVGVGPAISLAGALSGLALAALPLALLAQPVVVLALLFVAVGIVDPINNVGQMTVRQSATPDHLRARMNGIFRTIYWGVWPLGNLLGGWAGATLGLVPTIIAGGAFTAAGMLLMLPTPAGRLREHPRMEAAIPGPELKATSAGRSPGRE